mmetsp:Transcript_29996/g.5418  ORF Transcript_29996/g.5418 Transcript_29996/m.5418 type:complete len:95 (-) Transcript_29996:586-870(-)
MGAVDAYLGVIPRKSMLVMKFALCSNVTMLVLILLLIATQKEILLRNSKLFSKISTYLGNSKRALHVVKMTGIKLYKEFVQHLGIVTVRSIYLP